MQETRVPSLGWEGPLEEEMATHSSILAWEIQCTEEPGGLQSMGLQRVGHSHSHSHGHSSKTAQASHLSLGNISNDCKLYDHSGQENWV